MIISLHGKINFKGIKMFEIFKNKLEKNLDKIINNHEKKFFIFGLPKAGKSTVVSSLVRYIINDKEINFRRDPIKNKEGVSVFREWNERYSEKKFPLQTAKNEYSKLHIEYQHKGSEILERILMYEIAGEDVIKMDPIHENHTSFPVELKKFLFQSDGIIIMASSQQVRSDEEEVLQDFLEYLIRKKINIPICFILTKYDLVKDSYKNHVEASHAIYENVINLLSEYENSEVLSFSIGLVDGQEIIKDESKQYCSNIFNWIEEV